MIRRVYRAHPAMMISTIRPFLFVLILPVLKGVLQYAATGEVTGVLTLEVFAVLWLLISAALGVRAFCVSVDDGRLVIRKGYFMRSVAVIRRERLSSVSVRRGVFDYLFGSVTYTVNTEAGIAGKTDFSFKIGAKHAEELSRFLYGDEECVQIRFPALKTAIFAAATSSAVTGLLVGVPVINNAGRLLGVALSRMFVSEISRASSRFDDLFPPVVNLLTAVIVAGYTASFLITLVKMFGFRVCVSGDKFTVRYGFFVRRKTAFGKSAVNDVCVEQTTVMRLFGVFSVRAAVGGYGDRRGEKAVIVPAAKRSDVNGVLRDCFGQAPACGGIEPERSFACAVRFLRPARWCAIADVVLTALLSALFPGAIGVTAPAGVLAMAITVLYGGVCLLAYRRGRLVLGEKTVAIGRRRLGMREMYCTKERIGEIKITRTPADMAKGTCKVRLTVRSESADSVRVQNLAYAAVGKEIEKCFETGE